MRKQFYKIGILIILLFQINVFSQEKFPSRESKEWNDLTVEQRWQAVNIPEDQLSKMSTNELIEHCVNFDFMGDVFNYPNYGIGLNVVIENHNGLRELLLNRTDAGMLLLDFYTHIDFNKIVEIIIPADRGEFVAKAFFIELFLCHPNILSQFKGNEKELIKAILKTYDTCFEINTKAEENYYFGYSIGTKVLALGRAIDCTKVGKTDYPAFEEMDLSKLSDTDYHKIIEEARQL